MGIELSRQFTKNRLVGDKMKHIKIVYLSAKPSLWQKYFLID